MIYRSKAEKLVKEFIKQNDLDAEECPPFFEGLMYFRFVVEEDEEDMSTEVHDMITKELEVKEV